MLFNRSTPSILDSIWVTIVSLTMGEAVPLALKMESISSNIMTCNPLFRPNWKVKICNYNFTFSLYHFKMHIIWKHFTLFSSSSASAKSRRRLASLSPTNLSKICGPLTIFVFLAFNNLAISRAINVLPVPGDPKSKIPLMCWQSKIKIKISN